MHHVDRCSTSTRWPCLWLGYPQLENSSAQVQVRDPSVQALGKSIAPDMTPPPGPSSPCGHSCATPPHCLFSQGSSEEHHGYQLSPHCRLQLSLGLLLTPLLLWLAVSRVHPVPPPRWACSLHGPSVGSLGCVPTCRTGPGLPACLLS